MKQTFFCGTDNYVNRRCITATKSIEINKPNEAFRAKASLNFYFYTEPKEASKVKKKLWTATATEAFFEGLYQVSVYCV